MRLTSELGAKLLGMLLPTVDAAACGSRVTRVCGCVGGRLAMQEGWAYCDGRIVWGDCEWTYYRC
jgi:hypothetical protein